MAKKVLTAIDLFCGCGGISKGLQSAGFNVIAGADFEPKYMATFTHNFRGAKSLSVNLLDLLPEEFMEIVSIKRGELDLLAGGPPCQGFSKNVPRKYRFIDDPNNRLIKAFLNYCEIIQPKMVLMENVAEMKNSFGQAYSAEILQRLKKNGYTVTHQVLNAADYGVPQRRRRAFFIANREGIDFHLPIPTHKSPVKSNNQMTLLNLPNHVNVWDAISDLPSLNCGQGEENTAYANGAKSAFQKLMRGSKKTVKNHFAKKLKSTQYERLSSLQPGQGLKDLPKQLQTKGGYSGAYGRLTKDMICPTITRWVFHPGSGRWGHPVDIRVLTIREVARVQGFPDDFEFIGTYTDQAGQLGNAVPPLLAQRIAESMLSQLTVSKRFSNSRNSSKLSRSVSVGMEKVNA